MSPEEKAEEIYWKYYQLVADGSHPEENAKECTLIMVNELLTNSTFLLSYGELYYWNQVKQEIEKL